MGISVPASVVSGNGLSGTGTTAVPLIIASPTFNTVGSYSSAEPAPDTTRAVNTVYTAAQTGIVGASGSWRCMGQTGYWQPNPCASFHSYYLWCRTV